MLWFGASYIRDLTVIIPVMCCIQDYVSFVLLTILVELSNTIESNLPSFPPDVFCSRPEALPRMFLSLDLLSEYRIQHGAIGPLYVTSSYSTWIFCMEVLGFATHCPCDVCCRGLTTCLLHVGPNFGNRFLNTSWVVGLTYWIAYLHFFCILTSWKNWMVKCL